MAPVLIDARTVYFLYSYSYSVIYAESVFVKIWVWRCGVWPVAYEIIQ